MSLKKTIQHYSHFDKLTLFKYRKIKEDDYTCNWCEKRLSDSDVCYGCMEHEFFLHDVCTKKIPRRLNHPFHPEHTLGLQYLDMTQHCDACGEITFNTCSPCYVCQAQSCEFRIDFHCSKLFPTLKHECHHHLLTYFANITSDDQRTRFQCHVCSRLCGSNFYRCVQCEYNIHFQCLSLSSSAMHKCHRHPLVLMDSFKEDDSEEYYCDICEDERNPTHPVYYCEKCTFIAHVECVLHKDTSEQVTWSVPQFVDEALIEKEMEQVTDDGKYLKRSRVHEHHMKFYTAVENLRKEPYCSGCLLIIRGPGYICPSCPAFFLHEKCAKLPDKIQQHPFHSTHPLNLYAIFPSGKDYIICDECKDISLGFIYFCEECNFKLDVKCAYTDVSQQKDHEIIERATLLDHYSHHHQLILVNSSDHINYIECKICELSILGPAYFCPNLNCHRFTVHESCLRLPQKLQLPFHLDHLLVISSNPYSYTKSQFYACSLGFSRLGNVRDNLGYSCEQCDIKLHCICANYLRLPLKCQSHEHDLYYFGPYCQQLFASWYKRESATLFYCNKCKKDCNGKPFYRCLQCAIVFHLECVPIPCIVKSGCHRHPLVLKDSFVEDDSGEYYCDVCEEERYGNDHVYYCEECKGLFVAHIECALAKVQMV